MFDIRKYKHFARVQLKKRLEIPIIITLITAVFSFLFEIPFLINVLNSQELTDILNTEYTSYAEYFLAIDNLTAKYSSTLTMIIRMIAEAVFTVAGLSVYLKMSRSPDKVHFSDFIEGFNNWIRAAGTALWRFLWTTIWTMIFIIPGIIKSISYSQVFFLIAEYPELSIRKALRISMLITTGHKMDLVITFLSFTGWILLSILTLGFGFLILEPYMHMTFINAYHDMLKEALEAGKIKPEDFKA